MIKVCYKGPEDHVVISFDNMLIKFRQNEEKEVSEIHLPKLLANQAHKFVRVEAEAKILSARGRNRMAAKAEVKDGSQL